MLCYVILYYVMLCYVILCCVVLCYVVMGCLGCDVLCCVVTSYIVLSDVVMRYFIFLKFLRGVAEPIW